MITISIIDNAGTLHSKTRPTFMWAWRALMRARPDLVPELNKPGKDIADISIAHSPLLGRGTFIQLGGYFARPGMWIWRSH